MAITYESEEVAQKFKARRKELIDEFKKEAPDLTTKDSQFKYSYRCSPRNIIAAKYPYLLGHLMGLSLGYLTVDRAIDLLLCRLSGRGYDCEWLDASIRAEMESSGCSRKIAAAEVTQKIVTQAIEQRNDRRKGSSVDSPARGMIAATRYYMGFTGGKLAGWF